MGNYNNTRNRTFIICFVIVALLSVIVCIIGTIVLKKNASENTDNVNSQSSISVVSGASESEVTASGNSVTEITSGPEHSTPDKIVRFPVSVVKNDINAEVFTPDGQNTHHEDLPYFLDANDKASSFTFQFRAADGNTALGDIQLGFGISLIEGCPYQTTPLWYQDPAIYRVYSDSPYCTYTWTIPEKYVDYIDYETGNILFGHWQSNSSSVVLEKIICNKESVTVLPIDGKKNLYMDYTIDVDFSDDSADEFVFPVHDFLKDNQIPQRVYIIISTADDSLGEIECSVSAPDVSTGDLYSSENIYVASNNSKAEINWIVPDDIKNSLDYSKDFVLKLKSGRNQKISVDQMYIEYSLS